MCVVCDRHHNHHQHRLHMIVFIFVSISVWCVCNCDLVWMHTSALTDLLWMICNLFVYCLFYCALQSIKFIWWVEQTQKLTKKTGQKRASWNEIASVNSGRELKQLKNICDTKRKIWNTKSEILSSLTEILSSLTNCLRFAKLWNESRSAVRHGQV